MLNSNQIEVDILVNGKSIAFHKKDGRNYIQAKNGSEYEILVRNNSWSRKKIVSSVDGLDVLTGKKSVPDAAGYVLDAYQSFKIKGFRYNNDTVGAFKFVNSEKSYAASKNDNSDSNCGIIGVLVYDEKPSINLYKSDIIDDNSSPYWKYYSKTYNSDNVLSNINFNNCVDNRTYCSNTSMRSTSLYCSEDSSLKDSAYNFDMGSTWGSAKDSKVTSTTFDVGNLAASFEIYYASKQALLDMGVILNNVQKISFPRSFQGFAQPPKNWHP